jgi:hypothetical protein
MSVLDAPPYRIVIGALMEPAGTMLLGAARILMGSAGLPLTDSIETDLSGSKAIPLASRKLRNSTSLRGLMYPYRYTSPSLKELRAWKRPAAVMSIPPYPALIAPTIISPAVEDKVTEFP